MNKLNQEYKLVDKYRLIHWLNIRKTTIEVLNELLANKINKKICGMTGAISNFSEIYPISKSYNTLIIII